MTRKCWDTAPCVTSNREASALTHKTRPLSNCTIRTRVPTESTFNSLANSSACLTTI